MKKHKLLLLELLVQLQIIYQTYWVDNNKYLLKALKEINKLLFLLKLLMAIIKKRLKYTQKVFKISNQNKQLQHSK